jgi:hypothetical protein
MEIKRLVNLNNRDIQYFPEVNIFDVGVEMNKFNIDGVSNNKLEERESETKKRIKYTTAQLTILEKEFQANNNPNAEQREKIAILVGRDQRSIQIWFQNRRAKLKTSNGKAGDEIVFKEFYPKKEERVDENLSLNFDNTAMTLYENVFPTLQFLVGKFVTRDCWIYLDIQKFQMNFDFRKEPMRRIDFHFADIIGLKFEKRGEFVFFRIQLIRPPRYSQNISFNPVRRWRYVEDFTQEEATKCRNLDILINSLIFGYLLNALKKVPNARATLQGLSEMRTIQDVAKQRDMTIEEVLGRIKPEAQAA